MSSSFEVTTIHLIHPTFVHTMKPNGNAHHQKVQKVTFHYFVENWILYIMENNNAYRLTDRVLSTGGESFPQTPSAATKKFGLLSPSKFVGHLNLVA